MRPITKHTTAKQTALAKDTYKMEVLGSYGRIVKNGELADALAVLGGAGRNADDYRIEVRLLSEAEREDRGESFGKYRVIVTDLKKFRTFTFVGGPRHAWVAQLEQSLQPAPSEPSIDTSR